MANLDDLKKSISEASDEELMEVIRNIRAGRINFSKAKAEEESRSKVDHVLEKASLEDLRSLLSSLED